MAAITLFVSPVLRVIFSAPSTAMPRSSLLQMVPLFHFGFAPAGRAGHRHLTRSRKFAPPRRHDPFQPLSMPRADCSGSARDVLRTATITATLAAVFR